MELKELCKKYNGKIFGNFCVVEKPFPDGIVRIFISENKEYDFVSLKFAGKRIYIGYPDYSDPEQKDFDLIMTINRKTLKIKDNTIEIEGKIEWKN